MLVALSFYMDVGRPIPMPSRSKRQQVLVYLPLLAAAKLAIYNAMIVRKLSRTDLAIRLGWNEKQVRRLLDLNHKSRFTQLEAALNTLGQAVAIDVREQAPA